ncbi:peptidylprolyl isomerase [Cohnella kolymensis]|uniref:peptidylprolyl isomerase n=1 Tax=Cohnella kolymensis TaxID=1590652 RepID=UPI000695FE36|nr:peptidylprolyl isomerase [Cohnella kolymensis]
MLHLSRTLYLRLAIMMLAAVMLTAMISGCGKKNEEGQGSGNDNVIATYKGGQVTESEFNKYTTFTQLVNAQKAMYMGIPQFKEQFVKQYIVSNALLSQVSDKDMKEADKAAQDFKAELGKAVKTNKQLKDLLDKNNLSVDDATALFKNEVAFEKYYTAKGEELKPQVKEEEIKAEFNKNPSDYNIVSVRHILIGTVDPQTQQQLKTDEEALKIANEVKAKLDKGGSWDELAKQYSTDPGSKDKGGLYDKQRAGQWDPAFKEAANTQEIGKIGEPVKSQFGYHVMKVESREAAVYEKLKPEAKTALTETVAAAKLNEFLKAEEDKLDIKVTLPQEPTPSTSPTEAPAPGGSPAATPSASPAASGK